MRKIRERFKITYNTQAVLAGDSIVLYDEISLFDVETKTQKKIKIDKWQDQLTRVLHSDTKNNKLFLERRTRRNNILEVCDVNLKTGDVKVIIHEEGDPYIGIELASIHFINNYNDIIWWSERSGYGHFYHYDREGNLKNAITSGEWTAGKIVEIVLPTPVGAWIKSVFRRIIVRYTSATSLRCPSR